MRVAIIGGNLNGLLLSHMLLDHDNFEIYIFEERAEVGFPVVGSGLLINHQQWFKLINSWIPNMTIKSNIFNEIGMVFHRGWLEKDLAHSFISRGGQIKVRTIVDIISPTSLLLEGAGGRETSWKGDIVIDCSSSIESSLIGILSVTQLSYGWKRSDNLWESWHSSDFSSFPEDIVEIIPSVSDNFEYNTIDYTFKQSNKLFNTILKGNDKE
jgi:hypothetical protein